MKFKQIFLNERIVMAVVIVNACLLFIGGCSDRFHPEITKFFSRIDAFFTIFFVVEVWVKVKEWGWKKYWKDTWDRWDFLLTVIALPSLIDIFAPDAGFNTNAVLSLRLIRLIKILRVLKYIPQLHRILAGVKRGLKSSILVIIGFLIFIFAISILNFGLFSKVAPEYFGDPLNSMYSVFRLFTIEGWYDIPNAIADKTTPIVAGLTKLYFCMLLFAGGIIGMSFINSIFVDAMVSDNNDEVIKKLNKIEKELKEIKKQTSGDNDNEKHLPNA